jgi:hypothetical protein
MQYLVEVRRSCPGCSVQAGPISRYPLVVCRVGPEERRQASTNRVLGHLSPVQPGDWLLQNKDRLRSPVRNCLKGGVQVNVASSDADPLKLESRRLCFTISQERELARVVDFGSSARPRTFHSLIGVVREAARVMRYAVTPDTGCPKFSLPLRPPPARQQTAPSIVIGGGDERVTLRQVARYADACNIFQLDPFGPGHARGGRRQAFYPG